MTGSKQSSRRDRKSDAKKARPQPEERGQQLLPFEPIGANANHRAERSEQDPLELDEPDANSEEGWESQSMYEDMIDNLVQETFAPEVDACTPEESAVFRQELRAVGPSEFCRKHLDSGAISVKKMLTAFGVRPPELLEGRPDSAYLGLLTLAMSRELNKRVKIMDYNTVDDAVYLLKKSKNIVVVTGAGISTSLGIPDFRSKDTGLYTQLAKRGLGVSDPQDVFHIDLFREDPTIFFSVAKDILPSSSKDFTPTHGFIAMLQSRGKLLTNYSQNIDNVEANAGILPEKLVQCHGSFATASCIKCGYRVPCAAIFEEIKAGDIPRCERCIAALKARPKARPKAARGPKRKRSRNGTHARRSRRSYDANFDDDDDDDDDDAYDVAEAGVMKPDITFFGESLPDQFSNRLVQHDRALVDLVLVIGTSLRVAPVSEIVPFLPPNVPQIYISRTPVFHTNFDIDLLGDCDVIVTELCRRAGWELKHAMVQPNQKISVTPKAGYQSQHIFKRVDDEPGQASSAASSGSKQ
ncbi:DHS-like NAD/FAD-binding domain-containing protein [Xylaria sp. CBS 124048]|nr:DHS-like NAD/FAD-binding domain-containing protein [Xylaria sp. CBS 124048]